ncbi:unnamed protein product [Protopolystoma xenopodis]|uniref:Fibronectin type III domain protein n=1 Tax=Protopolystoma xenopodis TaxID=117903 RepID=A0A448WDU4_9PLAT|nr:unnamed protein product [Protopolystoma xenopodis]
MHVSVAPLSDDRSGALISWLPPATGPRPTSRQSRANLSTVLSSPLLPSVPIGYLLEYRRLSSAQDWQQLANLDAWQTSYEANDLVPGEAYEFRLTSKSTAGPVSSSLERLSSTASLGLARQSSWGRASTSRLHRQDSASVLSQVVFSKPALSMPFKVPAFTMRPPNLSGVLRLCSSKRPLATPAVELSWTPPREPLSGYIIDLYDLSDTSQGWCTVARVSARELDAHLPQFLISGLTSGQSYRFRVTAYRDDLIGRPLESTSTFRVPLLSLEQRLAAEEGTHYSLPPPSGPLDIVRMPTGAYRLHWHSASLSRPDWMHLLEDTLEYVIEQRLPGRRMWMELARTSNLTHLIWLDQTCQLRIRTGLSDRGVDIPGLRYNLIASTAALMSDWIRVDEPTDEEYDEELLGLNRETESMHTDSLAPLQRAESGSNSHLSNLLPDSLRVLHTSTNSVLLSWKPVPKAQSDRVLGNLLLEKRLIGTGTDIWEPVAQLPSMASVVSYEVTGLHPGVSYDFRLVAVDKLAKDKRSSRVLCLPGPVTMLGVMEPGLTSGTSRAGFLPPPRRLTARIPDHTDGDEIHFSWIAPELIGSDQKAATARPPFAQLRYRLEARASEASQLDWIVLAKSISSTTYQLRPIDLEELVNTSTLTAGQVSSVIRSGHEEPGSSGRRIRRTVSLEEIRRRHWFFRVIAISDGIESIPAMLPEPLALVPLHRRKAIRFLHLDNQRMINCALGQTLVVTIELEGEPVPHVTWHLNHQELYEDDEAQLKGRLLDYSISRLGENAFELCVDRIKAHHAGQLECRASNVYETQSVVWQLNVLAAARFRHYDLSASGSREFTVLRGDSWSIRLPLELPTAMIGLGRNWITSVWLERLTDSETAAGRRLRRCLDRPALVPRAHLEVVGGGRWVKMELDAVSLADQGSYRLWVENQAGQDCIDLELRIEDRPQVRLPPPTVVPHGPGTLEVRWSAASRHHLLPDSSDLLQNIPFTGYRVEYRREPTAGAKRAAGDELDDEASWQLLGTTSVDATSIPVGSLMQPDVDYRFRVRLENWHGLGPASWPSEPARLLTPGQLETVEPGAWLRRLSNEAFDSRYTIQEELASTENARLLRVREKATGRLWLSKVVEMDQADRFLGPRTTNALAHRLLQGPRMSPEDAEMEHAMFGTSVTTSGQHLSHRISEQNSRWFEESEKRRQRVERELLLLASLEHQSLSKLHEAYAEAKRIIWILEEGSGASFSDNPNRPQTSQIWL